MKIVKGKYAGQTASLHQFANDWMMIDLHGGRRGVIIRPDRVQLDPEEHATMLDSPGVGTFWNEWRLNDDGTFTHIATRPTGPVRN
jgi:hypothetical protein